MLHLSSIIYPLEKKLEDNVTQSEKQKFSLMLYHEFLMSEAYAGKFAQLFPDLRSSSSKLLNALNESAVALPLTIYSGELNVQFYSFFVHVNFQVDQPPEVKYKFVFYSFNKQELFSLLKQQHPNIYNFRPESYKTDVKKLNFLYNSLDKKGRRYLFLRSHKPVEDYVAYMQEHYKKLNVTYKIISIDHFVDNEEKEQTPFSTFPTETQRVNSIKSRIQDNAQNIPSYNSWDLLHNLI